MSRRTDVLNKYPAPRVSAVNQAVVPGCSQGSYVSYTTYTTTILLLYFVILLFGRSCYDDVRTGSSGINQPAEIRECGTAGIFTICHGARSASRRLGYRRCDGGRGDGGRNYNARARVNYDQKTLHRYWLRRAFFSLDHPFCTRSNHLSYIYVLTSPYRECRLTVSIFTQDTDDRYAHALGYRSPIVPILRCLGNKMSITERLVRFEKRKQHNNIIVYYVSRCQYVVPR